MKSMTFGLTLALAVSAAWAQETETAAGTAPASAVAGQEAAKEVLAGKVTVTGQRPGPGLWKVRKGEHVMYVFGVYGPLQKTMEWRSKEVETALAASQEYIPAPSSGANVGVLKGLTLLPHVIGLKKNPNGAMLKDVLTPEVYARWLALKAKYIGEDSGVERERPLFASQQLMRAGMQAHGFQSGWKVSARISDMAKKQNIKTSSVYIKLDASDPAQMMKDFKKSPMEDAACFAQTLDRLETDIEAMKARSEAWAKGQLSDIEKLSFADRENACEKAMKDNGAIKKMIVDADVEARLRSAWLTTAERALDANASTFAVLSLQNILSRDGYLAALEAKGYTVERPE